MNTLEYIALVALLTGIASLVIGLVARSIKLGCEFAIAALAVLFIFMLVVLGYW